MADCNLFKANHYLLLRGVYVSRKDYFGASDVVTSIDIRLREPNRQKHLTPEIMHTIEHLATFWLRQESVWGQDLIYWGPMACLTGIICIVKRDLSAQDVASTMTELFQFISSFDGEIPDADPKTCGNWSFQNVEGAKQTAKCFLQEVLLNIGEENMNYPAQGL